MSSGKIAAVVVACAAALAALWFFALRTRAPDLDAAARRGRAGSEAPCICDGQAGAGAGEQGPEATAPAPPEATREGDDALEAARYTVCEREETPARLARLALVEGQPELWALHCGDTLHLLAIAELAGALVPQRVALVQNASPSQAESVVATEPAAADLNGDGRPDLIAPLLLVDRTGTPRGGALFVLRQRAHGGFEAPSRLLHLAPSALTPFELAGDAAQDIAVLHRQDAATARPDELWVIQGGPAPVRIAQRPAGVAAGAIAALDLDLDGKDDLAIASATDGRVRLFLSARGPIASSEPLDLPVARVEQALAIDLDADGARELVLIGERAYVVRAARGNPTEPVAIAGSDGIRDARAADADADGKPDLTGYAHPEVIALVPAQDGAFERTVLASLRGELPVLYARVAQLDRDPKPDLLLAVLSGDGTEVELAIARNVAPQALVRFSAAAAPVADAALIERFTAQ